MKTRRTSVYHLLLTETEANQLYAACKFITNSNIGELATVDKVIIKTVAEILGQWDGIA